MTIILVKPKGVKFDKEKALQEVFLETPICVNFVYAKNGKLKVSKSKRLNDNVWDEIESLTDSPVLIHFNESDTNILDKKRSNWCPVLINRDMAMVSSGECIKANGETAIKSSSLKILSKFALTKVSRKIPNFPFTEHGKWLLENILRPTCGIAILNKDGEISILNEKYGYKFDGMWVFDSVLAELNLTKHNNNYYGWYE